MEQFISNSDINLLYFIQEHFRNDFLTPIFRFITDLGDMGLIWIISAVFFLIFQKTRSAGFAALLSITINFIITNGILKQWVARARPFETYPDIIPLISPPTDFSFPSGHTACAFALAFIVYKILPRIYGIPAITAAALMGFSRLYLAVHYPADVLMGVFAGAVSARLAISLLPYVRSFLKYQKKPVLSPYSLQKKQPIVNKNYNRLPCDL